MNLKYLLPFIFVSFLCGQTISDWEVEGETHSTARVGFTKSDTTTEVYVIVSTSTLTDCTTDTTKRRYAGTFPQSGSASVVIPVTGLAPSTTYKWAVCSAAGSFRGESTVDLVTTAAPSVHPALPTAVVPTAAHQTIPTTFAGGDFTETTCTAFQNRINSELAVAGRTDHTRIIKATAAGTCGNITITTARGAGSTGWVLITGEDHAKLPPWGAQALEADSNKMAAIAGTLTINTTKVWVRGLYVTGPATGSGVTLIDVQGGTDIVLQHNVVKRAIYAHTTRTAFRSEGVTRLSIFDNYIETTRAGSNSSCYIQEGAGSDDVWFRNNYMNCPGNSIYVENNLGSDANFASDYIIEKNIIDWNERYRLGSATSDGNEYYVWQAIEFKSMQRARIQGNWVRNTWPWQDEEANFLSVFPRVATCGLGSTIRNANNIEFSYNWASGGGGITIAGFTNDGCGSNIWNNPSLPGQNFWVHNNLWSRMRPQHKATGGNSNRLTMFKIYGVEDVIWENNAYVGIDASDYRQTPLRFDCGPVEGFVGRNNILRWANANAAGGLAFAGSCAWHLGGSAPANTGPAKDLMDLYLFRLGSGASYTFTHNAIAAQNPTTNGYTNATISGANWLPSGQYFLGDGAPATLAGFMDASNLASENVRNFCLDEFSSANHTRSTEGRQLGPNCPKLQEMLGGIYNYAVTTIGTTSATVIFNAPGGLSAPGTACRVDVSTDSAFPAASTTTFTATVDSGNPWHQSASLTGLTAGTVYYYLPRCAGLPQSGTLTTKAS